MDAFDFENQVQTLENVHPLISKFKKTTKKLGCTSYFHHVCLYLEVRGRTLTRV